MGKNKQKLNMQRDPKRLERIKRVQDERRRNDLTAKGTLFDSIDCQVQTNYSEWMRYFTPVVIRCDDLDLFRDISLNPFEIELIPFSHIFVEIHADSYRFGVSLSNLHGDDFMRKEGFREGNACFYTDYYAHHHPIGVPAYETQYYLSNGGLKISDPAGEWLPDSMIEHAFQILKMLTMRNIELVDNPPPAKVSAQYEREFGRPISTYKTLTITPTRKVYPESNDDTEGEQRHLRAHLVRGHPRKVEGHPFIPDGTYWIPAHVRGDFEQGIVVKDYKLKSG